MSKELKEITEKELREIWKITFEQNENINKEIETLKKELKFWS